ncbi:MAG TPA: hypothetical protein VLF79_02390 [Candidatus Saccharimonadales bacterium]|nr:hypothetical protein [Candidatus Saccharimonadales bacterium]
MKSHEQIRNARRSVGTALAIGTTLIAPNVARAAKTENNRNAAPAVASTANERTKVPVATIKDAIKGLNSVQAGDRFPVLEGKTTNMIVREGATVYRLRHGEVARGKIGSDTEVIHARYDKAEGWQLASFNNGIESISMPLNGNNERYVTEIYYDDRGKRHVRPLQTRDIVSRTVEVSTVQYGFAFAGPKDFGSQDHLSHLISTEVTGKPLVSLAVGVSGDLTQPPMY